MNRREFLEALATLGSAVGAGIVTKGCASVPIRPDGSPETKPVDSLLKQGASVMWIAAHPDDECFSGSLLARASIHYGNKLHMLVFTKGDGGECCIRGGCHPDLKTVRAAEMERVAAMYKASLRHESFFNAPLPVESFPKRHEIYAKWLKYKDPVKVALEEIEKFKPEIIVTFDPFHGATGHPEHQLASRVATAAIRKATHHVLRTYYVENRFWLFRILGLADPGPVTETWDARSRCKPGMTCRDFMLEATKLHKSQARDMGNVRRYYTLFGTLSLRQTDPFKNVYEPDART
ncbi:MAG: hypothetical protein GXP49_08255 [Deltaproteobacteria bacterium]|nr:hypothetical protein [Deltaproteobacteria bacterium]